MKTIALFSFFNSNNLGDQAISSAFFELLSERLKVVRCSCEGSFEITGCYTPERRSWKEKALHLAKKLLRRRYDTPRYRRFLAALDERIDELDAAVFGGGNLMMDYSPRSASWRKYMDYANRFEARGTPCFALSVGIGPFADPEQGRGAAAVLNKCAWVSFRDERSRDLFLRYGGDPQKAGLSFDPVFLLPQRETREARDAIAVNVIDLRWAEPGYARDLESAYENLICELTEAFPDRTVCLFRTEKNDTELLDSLYRRCRDRGKRIERAEPEDPEALTALYSGAALVIGARMHAMIIAFTQRVPVIGLSWSPKTEEFFRIVGHGNRSFELKDLGSQTAAVIRAASEALSEGWSDPNQVLAAAKQRIGAEIDRVVQIINGSNEP